MERGENEQADPGPFSSDYNRQSLGQSVLRAMGAGSSPNELSC